MPAAALLLALGGAAPAASAGAPLFGGDLSVGLPQAGENTSLGVGTGDVVLAPTQECTNFSSAADWRVRSRVLQLPNGERVPAVFSAAEYDRRVNATRGVMATLGVDLIVFTSQHNILYHTGFSYCAFGRRYAAVLTQGGVTTVSANIDYGQPWRRGRGDNVVYTDWSRDNYERALRTAASGTVARRVGIEGDHVTLDLRQKLGDAFPGAEFVDVAEAVTALRLVKSAEEIALIRQGAEIADIGGHAVVAALREGVQEWEVARAATGAMVAEISRRFPTSELMDTWTWFQSGPENTDGAHNPVTSRRVRAGDILSLNTFPHVAGYYHALERTLFFGHIPTPRHAEIWRALCDVHRFGMSLLRPGARCSDIAQQLNDRLFEHGLLKYRTFGYGHSFGVLSHYYGRESLLEIREDVETVLVPGMVVSMEPMLTVPVNEEGAGGYREHDILLVTAVGSELLTKFPFGPEYNVVPVPSRT